MKVAFTGSFDPPTLAHIYLIKKASLLFSEVVVLIGQNEDKKSFLSFSERAELIKKEFCGANNITVDIMGESSAVSYLKKNKITTVVRGIRDSYDLDYEFTMAEINKTLYPEYETVYLKTPPSMAHISSTSVRTLYSLGEPIDKFVSKNVLDIILKKKK